MLKFSPYPVAATSRYDSKSSSPTLIIHKSPSGRSLKSYRTKAVTYCDRAVGASPPPGSPVVAKSEPQGPANRNQTTTTNQAPPEPPAEPALPAKHKPTPNQPPQRQPTSSTLEPARSIAQLAIKRHASDATSGSLTTSSSNDDINNDEDEPMSDVSATAAAKPADELSSPSKKARTDAQPRKLVPTNYEDCDTKDLVLLIASMLLELIAYNDAIPLKDGHLTRFHSRAPPGISVQDYLQRLTTHATLSPPILLSMVYYIDRLCAIYPAFTITSLTVHRFLISSATVASKGLSDSFWTNKTYAKVGGVSLNELALLELEFLERVEWRIVPKPEVLVDYYNSLVRRSETHGFAEGSGG